MRRAALLDCYSAASRSGAQRAVASNGMRRLQKHHRREWPELLCANGRNACSDRIRVGLFSTLMRAFVAAIGVCCAPKWLNMVQLADKRAREEGSTDSAVQSMFHGILRMIC